MESSYHHGDLRRAIRDEAFSIIDREGLASLSLRRIARQLGVSEAAPYHHYAGKEELLAAMAAEAYRDFHVALLSAVECGGEDPPTRLKVLGEAYVRFGIANRGRFRLMFGEHALDLARHDEVVAAGRPTRELLTTIVQSCFPPGTPTHDFEETTWALVHGIAWLVTEAEIKVDADPAEIDRLVSTAMSVLLAGMTVVAEEEPGDC